MTVSELDIKKLADEASSWIKNGIKPPPTAGFHLLNFYM
jgi:hypothetical protein